MREFIRLAKKDHAKTKKQALRAKYLRDAAERRIEKFDLICRIVNYRRFTKLRLRVKEYNEEYEHLSAYIEHLARSIKFYQRKLRIQL